MEILSRARITTGPQMRSKEIRALLGVSRAEFSRRYKIPIRTLEDWDAGKREAPEWVWELLERVVKEDAKIEEEKDGA